MAIGNRRSPEAMVDSEVPFSLFSRLSPLEQFRRRLIIRVLLHQLPAHRQIQNEPPQPGNGIGRLGDPVEAV